MSYTPVEIRHVRLRRGLFGYRTSQVDHLLDEVVESFETVWRERADHSDRVELLKDQAKREAETIVAEAQAEARMITRQARSEYEMLAVESRRLRLLLHAALDALDEADVETADEEEEAEQAAHGAQTRAA